MIEKIKKEEKEGAYIRPPFKKNHIRNELHGLETGNVYPPPR